MKAARVLSWTWALLGLVAFLAGNGCTIGGTLEPEVNIVTPAAGMCYPVIVSGTYANVESVSLRHPITGESTPLSNLRIVPGTQNIAADVPGRFGEGDSANHYFIDLVQDGGDLTLYSVASGSVSTAPQQIDIRSGLNGSNTFQVQFRTGDYPGCFPAFPGDFVTVYYLVTGMFDSAEITANGGSAQHIANISQYQGSFSMPVCRSVDFGATVQSMCGSGMIGGLVVGPCELAPWDVTGMAQTQVSLGVGPWIDIYGDQFQAIGPCGKQRVGLVDVANRIRGQFEVSVGGGQTATPTHIQQQIHATNNAGLSRWLQDNGPRRFEVHVLTAQGAPGATDDYSTWPMAPGILTITP